MLSRSRPWRIALLVGLGAAFVVHQARAADTSEGSRNFSPPTSVPNYFSNEAGPLQGPASETRRGVLYMNQTYGTQQAAAAVPRAQQHIAMTPPRGRLVRGRANYAHRQRVAYSRYERHSVTHGRAVYHAAHAGSRGRVERVAARAHTVVRKTTHVSSEHRHGRG